MTRGELVDLVCTKVKRTDNESVIEARKYVRSRYQIIWDTRLWRDSLEMKLLQGEQLVNEFGEPLVDEDGEILTTGLVDQILIMPAVVSKVVACRWGRAGTLQNETLDAMFFLDPNRFEQTGEPVSFTIISPSGLPQSPAGRSLLLSSTSIDAMYDVTVHGTLGDVDQSEVIRLSGVSQVSSNYSYNYVASLAKNSSSLDLIVEDDIGTALMTLPRDETERFHQRVHLHSTPLESGAGEMLILYKRRIKNLNEDSDSTELGVLVDQMLLAAAIGDMREGERQYSKAGLKSQEVAALMQAAIQGERDQSASNPRIIPTIYDDGYGSDEISKQWM